MVAVAPGVSRSFYGRVVPMLGLCCVLGAVCLSLEQMLTGVVVEAEDRLEAGDDAGALTKVDFALKRHPIPETVAARLVEIRAQVLVASGRSVEASAHVEYLRRHFEKHVIRPEIIGLKMPTPDFPIKHARANVFGGELRGLPWVGTNRGIRDGPGARLRRKRLPASKDGSGSETDARRIHALAVAW